MANKVLVTSALPYIHGMPHLGNLVGSVLPADVFSRYLKLAGKEYAYICGSDAHGTSYEIEAIKKGTTPEEVVNGYHKKVQDLFKKYNIDFTYYGSTHSESNKEITYRIFEGLRNNNHLEEQTTENPYCEKDEMFLFDRLVEGECPLCGGLARGDQCNDCGKPLSIDEVKNPHCAVCKSEVIKKETKHLYLKLNDFQDWLKEWSAGKEWSPLAVGETKSWLNKELKPRPITRDVRWGFSVPQEGYENKVFYVWFDAPIGYIGITKEWADKNGKKWEDWWLSDDVRYVQFMGKDNVMFHSVMFPSYLKGSGEKWKLVDNLVASGWLLAEDVKFSKSTGTGLSAEEALDIAPVDVWRFVLMSLYPENDDTQFSWNEFQRRVNSELADNVGNFIHRTLTYTKKNFANVPKAHDLTEDDNTFLSKLTPIYEEITRTMESGKLRQALGGVLRFSGECNAYLNQQEPWRISDDKERVETILNICCHRVAELSVLLSPYIPESSEKICKWIGLEDSSWKGIGDLSGKPIGDVEVLFHKFDDEAIEGLKEKYSSKQADDGEDPFSRLDLRVAEIKSVENHPNADKLYVIKLDVGEERQIVSGIRDYYKPEELVGKKIIVVANLKPAELRGVKSEGMLLAGEQNGEVGIVWARGENGSDVYAEGIEKKPMDVIDIKEFSSISMEIKAGNVYYNTHRIATSESPVICGLDKGKVR